MTEVEQLWEEIDKLRRANETLVQQNADYQKLKAENEAIHEKLQQALNRGANDYEEIERLKGLAIKTYEDSIDKDGVIPAAIEAWVEQFKSANNL